MGRVAAANVALFVFNLIPAFPMDGGRVLRALLAIPLGYTRATRVAATIGQGLAFVFALLGLMGNPLLILIAVFIFLAASGEAGYVQMREYTRGYLASHAMITNFQTLGPTSSIDDAAGLLLRTTQQEFPVVDGAGTLRGVLTREALISALQGSGGATPVIEAMDREVPTVPENACLDNVFQLLQGSAPTPGRGGRPAPAARRLHHGREPLGADHDPVFAGRPSAASRCRAGRHPRPSSACGIARRPRHRFVTHAKHDSGKDIYTTLRCPHGRARSACLPGCCIRRVRFLYAFCNGLECHAPVPGADPAAHRQCRWTAGHDHPPCVRRRSYR